MESKDSELDIYTSSMHQKYGFLLRFFFRSIFRHIPLKKQQIQELKALEEKGCVIYTFRTKSTLDYLAMNYKLDTSGLKLSRFTNSVNLILWKPIWEVVKILGVKLKYLLRGKRLPNPARSGFLERILQNRESCLIFLRRSTSYIDRVSKPLWDPIAELVQLQKDSESPPIFLVPVVIVYVTAPEKKEKSVLDFLFGAKTEPGRLRKMMHVLFYHRTAFITIGKSINLKEFVQTNLSTDTAILTKKVRWSLLTYLYRETRVISGPMSLSRDRVVTKIMRMLSETLSQYSEEEKEPLEQTEKQAKKYAYEIVADLSFTYVYVLQKIFYFVWNKIYDGLIVDEEELKKVREALKDNSVVLVPSHKSHIDYLMLSYLFYIHHLTPPHIAAGQNLSFWPMGHIFRKSGAFFLRRSFKGLKLYPKVFQKYLRFLIKEGFPIEFFIEGGRSRSGKLLNPKMGMLKMILDAYTEGIARDLVFIPVAITYEKIIEENAYTSESLGANKQEENLHNALSAVRHVLKQNYGRVFLRFADPISSQDYLKERNIQDIHTALSQKQVVEDFANIICDGINQKVLITPSSLAATVLLSHSKRGLLESLFFHRSLLLRRYADWSGLSLAILEDFENKLKLSLQAFKTNNLIHHRFYDGQTIFVVRNFKKLHLDYYKNNIVHFFVEPSLCALAIRHLPKNSFQAVELEADYLFLKDILSIEFHFGSRSSLDTALAFFCEVGILKKEEDLYEVCASEDILFFAELLKNFMVSYQLVFEYYQQHRNFPDSAVSSLINYGHLQWETGEITRHEAISKENFKNAIRWVSQKKLQANEEFDLTETLQKLKQFFL